MDTGRNCFIMLIMLQLASPLWQQDEVKLRLTYSVGSLNVVTTGQILHVKCSGCLVYILV